MLSIGYTRPLTPQEPDTYEGTLGTNLPPAHVDCFLRSCPSTYKARGATYLTVVLFIKADWMLATSGIALTCQRITRTLADANALSFFASATCRSSFWCVASSSSMTASMLESLLHTTKSALMRLMRLNQA